MPELLSAWLSKESLKHPAVFILFIVFFGGVAGMAINPFVMAGEFTEFQIQAETRFLSIEGSICDLRKDVRSESLEGQLRNVESDIWKLERVVESEQGNARDEDRLDDLKSDKGKLVRQIQTNLVKADCLRK